MSLLASRPSLDVRFFLFFVPTMHFRPCSWKKKEAWFGLLKDDIGNNRSCRVVATFVLSSLPLAVVMQVKRTKWQQETLATGPFSLSN